MKWRASGTQMDTQPARGLLTSTLISNNLFSTLISRSEDEIDLVTNVNLKGTFYCTRKLIEYCIENNTKGVILNIASHYGIISPDPRIYIDTNRASSEIYGASKAAIIQMTKYFAVHAIKKNIRTNSVSPGGIADTDNVLGKKVLQKIKQGRIQRRIQ